MSNKVILLASVGTNVIRSKKESYDKIQEELAAYTGLPVLQVFTDDETAHAVSEDGEKVYTVESGVEVAISMGADEIVVVPVFMTKGQLYNELAQRLDFKKEHVDIKMTEPVLYGPEACDQMAQVFSQILDFQPTKEYLVVDHGNPNYHCAANTYLQEAFDKLGLANVKVIQLKERDSFGQAVAWLKGREADVNGTQVVIVPLIVAWGDYMANELYNDEESSLMWRLRHAGYRTVFTGEGFGEHAEFRAIYNKRFDELMGN